MFFYQNSIKIVPKIFFLWILFKDGVKSTPPRAEGQFTETWQRRKRQK